MDKKIAVVLPILIEHQWQVPMTKCAIDSLYCTTNIPFNLIIIETDDYHSGTFTRDGDEYPIPDPPIIHHHIKERGNAARDVNVGLNIADFDLKCTHTVYTGNDIFVRDGWLEAHLKCWEISDCGASTLASSDMQHQQQDLISEGVFGPHYMFESHRRFDEERFPATFGDTDMIMGIYKEGKRKYRNWNVVIQHLLRQTTGSGEDHQKGFLEARERFAQKHAGCPLWMYQALVQGIGI